MNMFPVPVLRARISGAGPDTYCIKEAMIRVFDLTFIMKLILHWCLSYLNKLCWKMRS